LLRATAPGAPDDASPAAKVEFIEQAQAMNVSAAAPRAQDTSAPEEALPVGEDIGALTHGILAGLGISVPLWLGIAWLVIHLAATLPGR
jgi:hypothetical protein